MTIDPLQSSGYTRVLQGQELSTLRGPLADSNESDSTEKQVIWPAPMDDDKIVVSASHAYESEKWPESTFTDLLSGFGTQSNSHEFCASSVDQTPASVNSMKLNVPNQEGKFSFSATNWSVVPSGLSLNLLESTMKPPVQGSNTPSQPRDTRYGGFGEYAMVNGKKPDYPPGNWFVPPPLPSYLQMPRPVLVQQHDAVKPNDGNCKLFGIHLNPNPVVVGPPMLNHNSNLSPNSQQARAAESDHSSEQLKCTKAPDHQNPSSEQEKASQPCQAIIKDGQGKVHGGSARSCTKVRTCLSVHSLLKMPLDYPRQ